jgi:hypothetical protein
MSDPPVTNSVLSVQYSVYVKLVCVTHSVSKRSRSVAEEKAFNLVSVSLVLPQLKPALLRNVL